MQGRILIIDDEPEILNAVKFYLEARPCTWRRPSNLTSFCWM